MLWTIEKTSFKQNKKKNPPPKKKIWFAQIRIALPVVRKPGGRKKKTRKKRLGQTNGVSLKYTVQTVPWTATLNGFFVVVVVVVVVFYL